jgi:hypothetical protein
MPCPAQPCPAQPCHAIPVPCRANAMPCRASASAGPVPCWASAMPGQCHAGPVPCHARNFRARRQNSSECVCVCVCVHGRSGQRARRSYSGVLRTVRKWDWPTRHGDKWVWVHMPGSSLGHCAHCAVPPAVLHQERAGASGACCAAGPSLAGALDGALWCDSVAHSIAQARWHIEIIKGRCALPSAADMDSDIMLEKQKLRERYRPAPCAHRASPRLTMSADTSRLHGTRSNVIRSYVRVLLICSLDLTESVCIVHAHFAPPRCEESQEGQRALPRSAPKRSRPVGASRAALHCLARAARAATQWHDQVRACGRAADNDMISAFFGACPSLWRNPLLAWR